MFFFQTGLQQKPGTGCIANFVDSGRFSAFSMFIISLNALFIFYTVNEEVNTLKATFLSGWGPHTIHWDHTWPYMVHTGAIYGPYIAIYGPYMAIYGPCMSIYGQYLDIWPYGHIWAIYGPFNMLFVEIQLAGCCHSATTSPPYTVSFECSEFKQPFSRVRFTG